MSSPIQLNNLTVQTAIELCGQPTVSDEKKLEIIESLVSKELFEVAKRFQEFHIGSEQYRYKAAALIGKKDWRLISYQIRNFELSQPHMTKIAYRAIMSDTAGTLTHIENYALNEDDAYAIGLSAAKSQPARTAEHFASLGITTEDKAFDVARTAFRHNARGCAKYIKNFCLADENKRFELLTLRLKEDADKALQLLTLFEIQDPKHKFAAALLSAGYDGWQFSSEIENWNVTSEADRFKLFKKALKCPASGSVGALRYLEHYRFSAPYLFAALELAIKNKVAPLIEFMQKSGVDEKSRFKLGLMYAVENPDKFLEEIEKWKFAEDDKTYLKDLVSKVKS